MSSYQYRKSHCGDKTAVRSSYLHNGISYTGKMSSLYWIGALALCNFRPEAGILGTRLASLGIHTFSILLLLYITNSHNTHHSNIKEIYNANTNYWSCRVFQHIHNWFCDWSITNGLSVDNKQRSFHARINFNEVQRGVYWFHIPLSVCRWNCVCSVSSTILAGSIAYLYI